MNLSCNDRELQIPINSFGVLGGCGGYGGKHISHSLINHDSSILHQRHRQTPPYPLSMAASLKRKNSAPARYKECLKNHAASIGGNATDGCGEFMPGGEEGSLEALKCSACSCHRNFHRKEIDGELMNQRGLLFSRKPWAIRALDSDEMEGNGGAIKSLPFAKRRFRTKFSPEQKEKMLGFAEKVGWRLQKTEESLVQKFCQEIGVKRRVLMVWMHNNKQNLAKKSSSLQLDQNYLSF
ncbi:hypothetical protein HPP92_009124 [Vanilla planifolia]|uniref:ZF-HD dimerization-type domain-containing protein n=1 Tax=Vanilla planifolia TaxID=51239 RepID=A0A835V4E8_VANPL|nr:hypothetical protein HPP92_009124 [Vanilla planifolia]